MLLTVRGNTAVLRGGRRSWVVRSPHCEIVARDGVASSRLEAGRNQRKATAWTLGTYRGLNHKRREVL